MIGRNINPDAQVRCTTYIVMKWIADDWKVVSSLPVVDGYRQYAQQQDLLNGCTREAFVTERTR
jgi:hypothetical protein